MKIPGRAHLTEKLSAYIDGELSPEERQQVETLMANDREVAALVADLRGADGLMRHALDLQADDVDWKSFTDSVMAGLPAERLPLFERLKLSLSEMFTWQRGPLLVGFASAAMALAVAIPLTMKLATPNGYGASRLEVQTVSVEQDQGATVQPVVMETDNGDAVIWVVENPNDKADAGKKHKKPRRENGEEDAVPDNEGEL